MNKKRNGFILLFLVAFAVFGLVFIFFGLNSVVPTEGAESENIIPYSPEYAFDVTEKELLVGDAPHVVVAEVKSKAEETKDDIGPITIYTVTIEDELKGSLEADTISVVQRIGYDANAGGVVKVDGDEYLSEGASYILVLRYDKMIDEYRITTPKYGNVLVKNQGESAYNETILAEFGKAIENQRKPEY